MFLVILICFYLYWTYTIFIYLEMDKACNLCFYEFILGKEELNYVLGIQEKGLSNRLGLKKKDGYPLWITAFLTYY